MRNLFAHLGENLWIAGSTDENMKSLFGVAADVKGGGSKFAEHLFCLFGAETLLGYALNQRELLNVNVRCWLSILLRKRR